MIIRRRTRAPSPHIRRMAGIRSDHAKLVSLWCLRALLGSRHYRRWAAPGDDNARLNEPEPELLWALGLHEPSELPTDLHELGDALATRLRAAEQALEDQEIPIIRNAEYLGEQLGLSPVERVLLCFAAVLSGTTRHSRAPAPLQQVLGAIGAATGLHPLSLIAEMIDVEYDEVERALAPAAPLVASGLLSPQSESGEPLVSPAHLVAALTRKYDDSDKLLQSFFTRVEPSHLEPGDFPHVAGDVALLSRVLRRALEQRVRGLNILVHGQAGTGKTELARVLAAEAGASLFAVRVADEEGEAESDRFPAYLLCQKLLTSTDRALVLFDEAEDVFPARWSDFFGPSRGSGRNKGWTNRQLEENPVPAIWVVNNLYGFDAAFLRRFDYRIELDTPPPAVRRKMIDHHLGDFPLSEEWKDARASDERLTPADIERASRIARLAVSVGHTADARAVIAHLGDNALQEVLDRMTGPQLDVRTGLRRTPPGVSVTRYDLRYVNTSEDVVSIAIGLARSGRGSLCLHGPPGTGKTAFARHLADRLERELIVRRASDLLGCYIGETEKALARMFQQARETGAILLLDEADSFLRDRRGALRRWEVTETNELLVQMECFEGIFLCATNLVEVLDPASLRRFDFKVRFGYLDREQRRGMFTDVCQQLGVPAGTPLEPEAAAELDRLGNLTPGDFAIVVRRARVVGAPESAAELLGVLREECDQKREGGGGSIGF